MQPSIFADSSNSNGSPLKNWHIIYVKKLLHANRAGIVKGRYESSQPKFLKKIYLGIIKTIEGNINVESININRNFFNGKLNLEKP